MAASYTLLGGETYNIICGSCDLFVLKSSGHTDPHI